jgi:hypothetical protein
MDVWANIPDKLDLNIKQSFKFFDFNTTSANQTEIKINLQKSSYDLKENIRRVNPEFSALTVSTIK